MSKDYYFNTLNEEKEEGAGVVNIFLVPA